MPRHRRGEGQWPSSGWWGTPTPGPVHSSDVEGSQLFSAAPFAELSPERLSDLETVPAWQCDSIWQVVAQARVGLPCRRQGTRGLCPGERALGTRGPRLRPPQGFQKVWAGGALPWGLVAVSLAGVRGAGRTGCSDLVHGGSYHVGSACPRQLGRSQSPTWSHLQLWASDCPLVCLAALWAHSWAAWPGSHLCSRCVQEPCTQQASWKLLQGAPGSALARAPSQAPPRG